MLEMFSQDPTIECSIVDTGYKRMSTILKILKGMLALLSITYVNGQQRLLQ